MTPFKHALATSLLILVVATLGLPISAQAEDFKLTSPTIKAGQQIGNDHVWNTFGCSGKNIRPELSWSGAPEGTKSFAITVYDPDAPTGSGVWHYSVYDIPANVTTLKSDALPEGAVEGNTDAGKPGFFGPCPPKGRVHRYFFKVHALKVDKLGIAGKNMTAPFTGFFINSNTIATAQILAVFGPR
ncbi:MAG: YbhB/YbcL family Raf kinase inhibitor-like protein [Hyphomicrobiaceae bacterium]